MIEMIALVVDNSIASVDDKIPVVLKAHLENFRKHIKDKNVVMGTNTYESIGESPFVSAKETIIMSRHKKYGRKVRVVHSTLDLIEKYKDFIVIGGPTLFADIVPLVDAVYITEVSETAERGNKIKLFPHINHLKLMNPDAEFHQEDDHYFRFLEYNRR